MKFWHIAAAIFASLQSIFTHAAPTGLAVRDPRWNETHGPLQYFIVQAPSEDLGPIANAIAAAVNGIVLAQYIYKLIHSMSTAMVKMGTTTATFSSVIPQLQATVAKFQHNFTSIPLLPHSTTPIIPTHS